LWFGGEPLGSCESAFEVQKKEFFALSTSFVEIMILLLANSDTHELLLLFCFVEKQIQFKHKFCRCFLLERPKRLGSPAVAAFENLLQYEEA